MRPSASGLLAKVSTAGLLTTLYSILLFGDLEVLAVASTGQHPKKRVLVINSTLSWLSKEPYSVLTIISPVDLLGKQLTSAR